MLITLCALAAVLLLATPALGDDIFIDHDWVINTDLVYDNDNIIVQGHINVLDGGSLTLRNSTMLVDSRRGDPKWFTVEETGNLYVYDSTLSNRYSTNNDERFYLNIFNDSVFINADISRLYGYDGDHPGGIRLLGGDGHYFEGCVIHDSRTYGIYTRVPLILKDTDIYSTGWARVNIMTSGRLYDMDFYISNCTFTGYIPDPYSYGVQMNDDYSGQFTRYVNITNCKFVGLSYGIYFNPAWANGVIEGSHNNFDRCTYGVRGYSNSLEVFLHHNYYSVRSGGIAMRISQGSYGNITYRHEDIRGDDLGDGYGLYLEGAGHHMVKDISIWNNYYGIRALSGSTTVIDSYINVSGLHFYVSGGATIDVYNTPHKIGSGFVDASGGRVTAWQRVRVSSVEWSDGTPVSGGLVYLLNETDFEIGTLNLSTGQDFLDFKRWETKLSYIGTNEKVLPAILDRDTYFRAAEIDIMDESPQKIVFTDDFTPRLTVEGLEEGTSVNVSYLIVEGTVVERGRGLANVDVSLDGITWSPATVAGEMWDLAFSMLGDGLYDVYVRAVDRAGNTASTIIRGVIVDTEPPPIHLISEPPTATNEPYLHLEGRTEPGAVLYLGQLVIEPDAVGNFTIDYPLNEGANGLVLRVMDVGGNWNQTVMSVLLDTVAPSLTVLRPGPGLVTNGKVVEVSGLTDNDAIITVDGEEVGINKGTFATDLELEEGVHAILIEAVDLAGNAASVVVTVIVDITAPTLEIERPSEATFTTREASTFIAGRMDDDLSYIFINGENRSALPGEFAIQVDLVEGVNTFTIVAMDPAGNKAQTVITITKDTRAPKYTVEDVTVVDGTISMSGSDKLTKSSTLVFNIRVDEDAVFNVMGTSHQGNGHLNIEYALEKGSNVISIEVEDVMGNLAEPYHYTIIYDPDPPNLVITAPVDGFVTDLGEIQITGVTEDARSQVWVNDVPAGVLADGSYRLTVALDWGDNAFTVRSRDRAGNEAQKTVNVVRKEKEEVQESNVGSMVLALVVGLVIGIAVMFVWGKSKGGGGTAPGPDPQHDGHAPPPPPPEEPKGPGGEWNEY